VARAAAPTAVTRSAASDAEREARSTTSKLPEIKSIVFIVEPK
jgi:hypothetical protein